MRSADSRKSEAQGSGVGIGLQEPAADAVPGTVPEPAREEFLPFVPPTSSATPGAALYVESIHDHWGRWSANHKDSKTRNLKLLTASQLSVAVVLNQFGRYDQPGSSKPSDGAPLQFFLNGYRYRFHQGEFPEYDRLVGVVFGSEPSEEIPEDLVQQLEERKSEALAYLRVK